jgi:hypothetical protein
LVIIWKFYHGAENTVPLHEEGDATEKDGCL